MPACGVGLDDVRRPALVVGLVEVLQVLAGVLAVGLEVEVHPVRDALELAPFRTLELEAVLDVDSALRVVRQLFLRVFVEAEVVGVNAETGVPVHAGLIHVSCHSSSVPGSTKNSISICSNSRVRKMKLPGVISLRKLLPIWPMPNGGFLRVVVMTWAKLMKMPWAVSGAQVVQALFGLDRARGRS